MRSVKFIVAAGAASLLSSVAFAADMPSIMPAPAYAPPPVEDFGGWYLRGDIGFSNQQVKNVRSTDNALYAPVTSLNQTSDFDAAGIFGVGVGYQFNNWFRADVTGQYRGNANFKGMDLFNFNAGGGTTAQGVDNYSASKSELLFLANVYADLGTWWCVTPFIGAGVGTSRVTISNFTDTGINNSTNSYSVAYGNSGSKWNFAWAAHAGLAYKVSPNLTLELAYSYVDLGSGATGGSATYGNAPGPNVFNFKNITSNDVTLGLRWQLDNPPVYAPPPLVTKG
jgi:opacity protein-like surface antigen